MRDRKERTIYWGPLKEFRHKKANIFTKHRSIDEFWGIYLVYYNWEILTEVSYKYSSFFVVWFFSYDVHDTYRGFTLVWIFPKNRIFLLLQKYYVKTTQGIQPDNFSQKGKILIHFQFIQMFFDVKVRFIWLQMT